MKKDVLYDFSHIHQIKENTLIHVELSKEDNESVIVRYSLYGKQYGTIIHKDTFLCMILHADNDWISKNDKEERRKFNEDYFGVPLHKPAKLLP